MVLIRIRVNHGSLFQFDERLNPDLYKKILSFRKLLLTELVRVSGSGGWFLLRLSRHDPVLPFNIEVLAGCISGSTEIISQFYNSIMCIMVELYMVRRLMKVVVVFCGQQPHLKWRLGFWLRLQVTVSSSITTRMNCLKGFPALTHKGTNADCCIFVARLKLCEHKWQTFNRVLKLRRMREDIRARLENERKAREELQQHINEAVKKELEVFMKNWHPPSN